MGNYLGRPTSDITDKVLAYREGTITFADLKDFLAHRVYLDPPHYALDHWTMDDIESADRSAPGTWGEVTLCYDRGLLTHDEYQSISVASHEVVRPGG